eukprot:203173-Alexandrium_andersonii.AAC.1
MAMGAAAGSLRAVVVMGASRVASRVAGSSIAGGRPRAVPRLRSARPAALVRALPPTRSALVRGPSRGRARGRLRAATPAQARASARARRARRAGTTALSLSGSRRRTLRPPRP